MRAGEMAMSWEKSDFDVPRIGFHKLLGFWNNQTNQTSKESFIESQWSQHCDFHAFSIVLSFAVSLSCISDLQIIYDLCISLQSRSSLLNWSLWRTDVQHPRHLRWVHACFKGP
jgi:hypothetical protein